MNYYYYLQVKWETSRMILSPTCKIAWFEKVLVRVWTGKYRASRGMLEREFFLKIKKKTDSKF